MALYGKWEVHTLSLGVESPQQDEIHSHCSHISRLSSSTEGSCSLRSTNGKGTVQHAGSENKAIACPSGLVDPLLPYKAGGGVSLTSFARHDGAYQDGDKATSKDEEQSDLGKCRKSAVQEHDNEC